MVSGSKGRGVVWYLRLAWSRKRRQLAAVFLLTGLLVFFRTQPAKTLGDASGLLFFPDSSGSLGLYSTNGPLDSTSPFFQVLGTNGRSCDTCHKASDAYSITPLHIQERFAATNGADPLFRSNDGSNCSDSTGVNDSPPAESAFSLLLNKGLIRFSLPIPSNAQFTATVVSDPYGCAMTTDSSGSEFLTVYRRVPPATNLRFLSNVMSDGRESIKRLNDPATFQSNLNFDLMHQALDARQGRGRRASAPDAPEQSI
jgi:cytochrome c peroxidase